MNCLNEEKKAVLFTVGFVLLCCSLLLLFARGSFAAWDEADFEGYPPVWSDEYPVMEPAEPDKLTLGESSGQLPPDAPKNDSPSGLSEEAQAALLEDVKAIRADVSLFLYGVLPVMLAALVLFKGCIWFYRTFIAGAFE